MQDLLVTGFSERDENTVLYILARTHPGSRHVVLPRARKPGVASQEQGAYADSLCIVDLDGIGLAQHSPENERALMSFLAGRSAVLVTSHLPTWQSRRLPMLGEQAIASIPDLGPAGRGACGGAENCRQSRRRSAKQRILHQLRWPGPGARLCS